MNSTEHTRKPIDELKRDDLDAFPIWEFAIDEEGVEGQDETWVRPVILSKIPRTAYTLSVAADFVSPNGSRHTGIMDVTTALPNPFPSACLIVGGRYTYIGGTPGSRERKKLAKTIGGEEQEIFPLTYTLRVLVEGESSYRSGLVA